MGLRDRGLCCHWAEDLHAELRKLNINSLKVAWLIARQGNQLREHNSIVIYADNITVGKKVLYLIHGEKQECHFGQRLQKMNTLGNYIRSTVVGINYAVNKLFIALIVLK